MSNKHSLATVAALLATTLVGMAAFAQAPAPAPAPMPSPGMMQRGGMMDQADMAEMRMVMKKCNNVMERAAQGVPSNPASPDRKG